MTVSGTLHRNKTRGWVGGICAGLADYFMVNPGWVRLTLILWSLASGLAVVAYLCLWVFLSEEAGTSDAWLHRIRHNTRDILSEGRRWSQDVSAMWHPEQLVNPEQSRRITILGGLITFAGLLFLADRLGLFVPFHLRHLWPLVMILMGAIMLNRARRV